MGHPKGCTQVGYTVLHYVAYIKHCFVTIMFTMTAVCVTLRYRNVIILQTFSTAQVGVQEPNGQKCRGRYDKISGES